MKKSPNVIVILSDDQGYGDISLFGNPLIQTPTSQKWYSSALTPCPGMPSAVSPPMPAPGAYRPLAMRSPPTGKCL